MLHLEDHINYQLHHIHFRKDSIYNNRFEVCMDQLKLRARD